jgi:hypothetical protein
MIEISEMHKGLIVWWAAIRSVAGYSCLAVVTEIKPNSFRVRSLEDFKISRPLSLNDVPGRNPSPRNKMYVASEQEVRDYLKTRAQHLADQVTTAQRRFTVARKRLRRYETNGEQFLTQAFPPST